MRNSKLILCNNINLDIDSVNVLDLNEENMLALCNSKKIAEVNNFSFIRNNDIIYTEIPYDTCLQATYLAFQNPDYSNKWFFAFITDIVYKGDRNTEIHYKIDSWSTWFSYWTPKMCYTVREHVSDDTIGLHTIDEGLDVGEIVTDSIDTNLDMSEDVYIVIATNYTPGTNEGEGTNYNGTRLYNKNFFSSQLCFFDISTPGNIPYLALFLYRVNVDSKISQVQDIFAVPKRVINASELVEHTFNVESWTLPSQIVIGKYYTLPLDYSDYNKPYTTTLNIAKSNLYSFSNFSPRNNKCYVYPYNYIYASNNSGENNIYKIEDFSNATNITFNLIYALSIGGSCKLYPTNYKGQAKNIDESINLGKLPTYQWSSDAYTNWLTQNAINNEISIINSIMQPVNTLASGNLVGGLESITMNTLELQNRFYQASLLPSRIGGTNTGDVNFSANLTNFSIKRFRPKNEYLQNIDNWFTRFGYKVSKLKVPNITGRRNFNYIEIGPSEEIGVGNVPNKYWSEINSLCRRGVTIWHNHNNVGNYNVQNDII